VLVGATLSAQKKGTSVSHVHLRYINPLPADLEDIMRRFKRVMVAEINLGQLSKVLREKTLIDVQSFNQVRGQPFKVSAVLDAIETAVEDVK